MPITFARQQQVKSHCGFISNSKENRCYSDANSGPTLQEIRSILWIPKFQQEFTTSAISR
jgi:hypothetical protein